MREDGWVTTINPGISKLGWGHSVRYAYQSRVGQERITAIRDIITNYMYQNDGRVPNLPGVNVDVFINNELTVTQHQSHLHVGRNVMSVVHVKLDSVFSY